MHCPGGRTAVMGSVGAVCNGIDPVAISLTCAGPASGLLAWAV